MLGKWHPRISAIHAGTARVNQMLDSVMPASFEHVDETHQVAVHIGMRIHDRITNAGLGGQVNDAQKFFRRK
jgi:hypothetical protein